MKNSLKRIAVLLAVTGTLLFPATAQQPFRVMEYNVENLFDCRHDSLKNDKEFLPTSVRGWNYPRFSEKVNKIAKVILAASGEQVPDLVALCEVENDSVMHHLLTRTSLRQMDYRYCITHGQDQRGINVALLYQRNRFKLLGSEEIRIVLPKKERPTRNILHVWGIIQTGDTLDAFVCHMPSRSGGEMASRPKRKLAALRLRSCVDSILSLRSTPQCLIMGDFNDMPEDESLSLHLKARAYPPESPESALQPKELYNLFYHAAGSYKYKGEWNQLDHLIVNGLLLDSRHALHLQEGGNQVYRPAFLFTDDNTWRGKRPVRTYYGYKYEGGYSDHLPLLCTFTLQLDSYEE